MFGFEIWVILAVVLSVIVVLFSILRMQTRGWAYRLLVTIGFLALIWGVLPILGGGKMSPYLVVGAIVAFGFLVRLEAIGVNLRW